MIDSIRSRQVFQAIRTRGQRITVGPIRLRFLNTAGQNPQIAFAFSRKFGKAVDRNRARRRLKSAFETVWSDPAVSKPRGGAYLLAGTRNLLSIDYNELVANLALCISKIEPVADYEI